MLKNSYFSLKNESNLNFCFTILLFFLFFRENFCQQTCDTYSNLNEDLNGDLNEEAEICFNNIIKFDHKRYQSNNFAINKNGDLILELTEYNDEYDSITSSRLFYGLTKEGKYFF